MKKKTFGFFVLILSSLLVLFFVSCNKKQKTEDVDTIEATQTEDSSQESVASFKYELVKFKYKSYDVKDVKSQINKVSDELIEKLRKLSSSDTVYVYGYADKKGPEEKTGDKMGNIALSKKRAQSVANYLTSQYNIPNSLFTIVGKGSSELKNSNAPYSEKNRRVVISYK